MAYLDKYSDEDLFELLKTDVEEELHKRGYEYGWHKRVQYAGDIYILVNPAFPNLVKIGYVDNVEKRVKQFNSNSGLPDPYHIFATYKVKKRLEDLKLHNLIDSLDSDLRHSPNREFYEMSPEKAYEILSAIAQINGDEDLLVSNPLKDNFFTKEDSLNIPEKKKPKFSFPLLGIAIGEELHYVDDNSITAVVNGKDTVEFEEKTWKLSSLVRELKTRSGIQNSSGSYQGGLYFMYKGKRLTTIRDELENQ